MRRSAAICRCSRFCADAGAAIATATAKAENVVFLISVRCNHKVAAAVPRKCLIRFGWVERKLLAVADRADAVCRNAECDEERLYGDGPPFSARQIVFGGPA